MVPADRVTIEEWLLRGAGTLFEVEAAVLLIIRADGLLEALNAAGLLNYDPEWPRMLSVDFAAGFAAIEDGRLELSTGQVYLFEIAASIAGKRAVILRHRLNLSAASLHLVLLSVAHAAGYMDPAFDLNPDGGTGPNALAHGRRVVEPDGDGR